MGYDTYVPIFKGGFSLETNEEMIKNENNQMSTSDVTRTNPFGWGKFFLFFLTYIGLMFGLQFIGMIIYLAMSDSINFFDYDATINAILKHTPIWLILDAIGFVITIVIFKSVREYLRNAFSFKPLKKWSTYIYIIGAFLLMYLSQYVILDVLKLESATEQVQTFGLEQTSFKVLTVSLLFLAVAIVTPIKEEILFRGVLHQFLSDKWHFVFGLIISSIIFGVLHVGYPIAASIMGVIFVLLYYVTRSLIAPIILHVVWNAYALVTLIVYVNNM